MFLNFVERFEEVQCSVGTMKCLDILICLWKFPSAWKCGRVFYNFLCNGGSRRCNCPQSLDGMPKYHVHLPSFLLHSSGFTYSPPSHLEAWIPYAFVIVSLVSL
jgi:hypothetical protein